MMPVPRWMVPLLVSAALLGAACSNGSAGERGSGSTTTTSTSVAPTTTSSASPTTAPAAGASTTRPVSTPSSGVTTIAATATTQPAAGGPLVASAGGWRVVITQPAPGSTIGSVAVLCYEVTGSVREAIIAFDVTFLAPGATTGTGPVRIDAAVGRGTARVPLTGLPSGRYDVRIQLIVDGSRVEGAVVTTTVNVVAGSNQIASC